MHSVATPFGVGVHPSGGCYGEKAADDQYPIGSLVFEHFNIYPNTQSESHSFAASKSKNDDLRSRGGNALDLSACVPERSGAY